MAKVAAVAKLTVVEGKAPEALPVLRELVRGTDEEPGTLVYSLGQDRSDPNVFWFFELYDSEEALAAHGQALRERSAGLRGLVAGPPEVHLLTPEAAKGLSL